MQNHTLAECKRTPDHGGESDQEAAMFFSQTEPLLDRLIYHLACFTWRALLALSQFEDRKNGAVVRRDRFVKNFGFHHAPSIR